MNEITKSITFLKEYKQLKQAVDEGKTPVLAVGLSAIHKAHLAAALGLDTGRPWSSSPYCPLRDWSSAHFCFLRCWVSSSDCIPPIKLRTCSR